MTFTYMYMMRLEIIFILNLVNNFSLIQFWPHYLIRPRIYEIICLLNFNVLLQWNAFSIICQQRPKNRVFYSIFLKMYDTHELYLKLNKSETYV